MLSQKVTRIIKVLTFSILAFIIFGVCNLIVQPIFDYTNYDTTYGFYKEPSNTIETVFLGSSHIQDGVNPMRLYEDYGICSYNLSTNGQSLMASYYWLEEAYHLHPETLDTVVLDTSMLRQESDMASYHRAIDPMHFSLRKISALKAYSEDFEDALQNMFPILSYHERWKELSSLDFLKYELKPALYLKGYYYNTERVVSEVNNSSGLYTPSLVLDENEADTKLDDTELSYFEKMVSFCKDHNIRLILIKTPTAWTSADHNAIQSLAETYGLDVIDFNIEPYYSAINYNFAADSSDATTSDANVHANYYGALKITDYLGSYLIEECGNHDVRGNEKYKFMEEELDEYRQYDSFRQFLLQATDPCDYIEIALGYGDCTIFISVKDDAAQALTKEQRDYFESIGLTELSQIDLQDAYLAVIDDGKVITEKYETSPGENNVNDDLISYTGTLHNGTSYTVISGGFYMGNKSSIMIADTERSDNLRGLNIAIYDNKFQRYITNANFDTHEAPERTVPFNEQNYDKLIEEGTPVSSLTGTDRLFYLYNRECENEEIAKLARLGKDEEDGLITYLKAFWDDEDIDIFITAQGDSSEVLTSTLRTDLSELGLSKLSQLSYSDSYVAAICNGDIIEERLHYSKVPLEVSSDKYSIKSIGREGSDDTSSVIINGTEYAPEQDGIFIVIYDNVTEMAVDTITFEPKIDDTFEAGEAAG